MLAMGARFHCPDAVIEAGRVVTLPREEAEHASRVLRLGPGDLVTVFDGRGREGRGHVEADGPDVSVRLDHAESVSVESSIAITIAHAVLKGDKMDEVVRDAVMLGAARVVPVVTARGEVPLAALTRRGRVDRWRRIATASAKQCGRTVVTAIDEPCALVPAERFLDAHHMPAPRFILVEPSVGSAYLPLVRQARPSSREATLLVGPEGGWSPEEVAGLRSACTPVTLGPRTLRADAVVTVALAALGAAWDLEGTT
jgi:16S rRNA (uracil1498-N3)-methyltransferase